MNQHPQENGTAVDEINGAVATTHCSDGRSTHFPATLIATLALLASIAPLAIDMYLPAFPAMAVQFDTSASAVQLTLTTFLVGLALGQLVIGPLSDRYGRRPLLLAGTLICALFSAACALAPTIEVLAVSRFGQGFAGAAGIVLGRAVISDRARGAAAAKLFSLLIVINAIAPIIAPLLGGVIVSSVGWRGVFWALAVLAAVMFMCVLAGVSESHPPERRTTGGTAALLRDACTVLRDRRYLGFTLAYAFAFGVLFAYISASPFVLQNVHGLSTTGYTIAFTANAIGLVISSVANSGLVAKFGERGTLRIGLVMLAVFSALILINSLVGPALWATLILLWCAVTSLGLVIANATALALGQARQAAGTGSAILGALQFLLAAGISPLVGIGGEHTAVPNRDGRQCIDRLGRTCSDQRGQGRPHRIATSELPDSRGKVPGPQAAAGDVSDHGAVHARQHLRKRILERNEYRTVRIRHPLPSRLCPSTSASSKWKRRRRPGPSCLPFPDSV